MTTEKQAQIAVMKWLIGQCTDQMVRGWLIQMRDYYVANEAVEIK